MIVEQRKNAVRRLIERGFNGQNLSEFDRYFAANMVAHHLPPGVPVGVEGTKANAAMFLAAFPNLDVTIEELLCDGDYTVLRWSARGNQTGVLMGMPPTGRQIDISGIAIDRWDGECAVEHWENIDLYGMLVQLGAIAAPVA